MGRGEEGSSGYAQVVFHQKSKGLPLNATGLFLLFLRATFQAKKPLKKHIKIHYTETYFK